jgi:hypothetical protein
VPSVTYFQKILKDKTVQKLKLITASLILVGSIQAMQKERTQLTGGAILVLFTESK